MKNKRGYYRFADIGMFFLSFAIVSVGIAIGIYLFYSNTIDIRDQEAKIISDRLVITITKNGKLNDDILKDDFNILKEAKLNDKIINNGDFYFKIEIFDNSNIIKKIERGNGGFEVECFLKGKKFPKCAEKELLLDNYRVKILAASNQLGEI